MTVEEKEELKKLVRSVKDFPEKGVTFRDITTALKDKRGLEIIIKDFTDRYKNKGIDYVVGADARGFIFGAAIAYNIGAGFVPARKPGKLPAEVESVEYSLEYGKNSIDNVSNDYSTASIPYISYMLIAYKCNNPYGKKPYGEYIIN